MKEMGSAHTRLWSLLDFSLACPPSHRRSLCIGKIGSLIRRKKSRRRRRRRRRRMGWKWVDDDADGVETSGDRGFGELLNPNPKSPAPPQGFGGGAGDGGETDRCSTRTVVQSRCRTEEVEPGRFVRKCEKTHQVLRNCIGRPPEVLESTTEHTEDDVTDEMKRGAVIYDSPPVDPFTLPGFRSDIEAIERSLTDNFGQFMEAAEKMANGIFNSFENHSWRRRESTPFGRHANERHDKDPAEEANESAYAELAKQVREV